MSIFIHNSEQSQVTDLLRAATYKSYSKKTNHTDSLTIDNLFRLNIYTDYIHKCHVFDCSSEVIVRIIRIKKVCLFVYLYQGQKNISYLKLKISIFDCHFTSNLDSTMGKGIRSE